ncbi:hypothetical protein DL240_02260 [Lujinxingia litoralis]|uniref:Uncharacterized protein n=1 Tax=Lujinxingia litoralis TaxID=2211119 RepID=A0A328CAP6_9DELT|nr:hypothetical protein [Lujinxingia litoralis]RAL25058.1 hypothetical protein DL240_02260 [Lujinxingia litoralis]
MSEEPIDLVYHVAVERPREGVIGRTLAFAGRRPVIAGLTCGALVVLIAVTRAYRGVANEPMAALTLSFSVIATWTVLFVVMRNFFKAQSMRVVSVARRITWKDDELVWSEQGQERLRLRSPVAEILTTELPLKTPTRTTLPWPVWLVLRDAQDAERRLVLESKVDASQLRDTPRATPELLAQTDETLPTLMMSPLLVRARAQKAGS